MSEKTTRINKKIVIIGCIVEVVLIVAILFSIFYENPTYKTYLSKGQEYFKNNQYEKALESFDKALEIKPNGVEALVEQSDVYMEMKEHDKAIAKLEEAKTIAGNDPVIYDKLIIACVRSDNIEKANEVVMEVVQTEMPTDKITSVQPAPKITPNSGSYKKALKIKIDGKGSEPIYYTNGKIPTTKDKKYDKPIELNGQGQFRITAMIIQDNGLIGFPVTKDYTIDLETEVEKKSDKYLGTWSDGETTLSITDIDGDRINFSVSLSWVDEINKTSSSGTVKNGIMSFSYTDNWGNKGTGTMWFDKNAITIRFREKESPSSTTPGFGKYTAVLKK